ncbi:MAG: hypothetical protein PHV68_02185 [Candidatus Gastranaerophilales bacterium]|nr:hypothetical protein [Candidatus Gastranaerophilales bacterium]
MKQRRGQGLTEFILIAVLVGLVALVFLTPFGYKIKSFMNKSAPVKNSGIQLTADYGILENIFGIKDQSALIQSVTTLKNSEIPEEQDAGSALASVLNTVSNISEGTSSSIENLNNIFSILKNNSENGTIETSGSLAELMLASTDMPSLTVLGSIQEILEETSVSLDLNDPAAVNLINQTNSTLSSLQTGIISGEIPREVLLYEGSVFEGLMIEQLTDDAINTAFENSYSIDTAKIADIENNLSYNPIDNFSNTFLLTQNIMNYEINEDLLGQIASLTDITYSVLNVD